MDTRYIDPKLLSETLRLEQTCGLINKELQVGRYENATIYPGIKTDKCCGGGVVDSNCDFVYGSSAYNEMPDNEGAYECENLVCSDEEVVYAGMFVNVWGHCITDCLRRLWFLNSPNVPSAIKGLKIVYTMSSWGGELPENFWEMISLLGFKKCDMVRIERPTRFRCVYLPESSFQFVRDSVRAHMEFSKEFVSTVDRIITSANRLTANRKPVNRKSIYLSRSKWKSGMDFGEKIVEKVFRGMGFDVVHPQRMSFLDLVHMLQNVDELAATEGSIAHNALFMRPHSKCYIVRKRPDCILYQPAINQIRKLEAVYIDANKTTFIYNKQYPAHGPFFMYANRRLSEFAGVKIAFPVFEYIKYFLAYFRRRMGIRTRFKSLLIRMKNLLRAQPSC